MLAKRGFVAYVGLVALVFVLTNVPSYRRIDYGWSGDDFAIDALKYRVGFPWAWFERVQLQSSGDVPPFTCLPDYFLWFPGARVAWPALISDWVVAAAIAALVFLVYRTLVAPFLPGNVTGLWWRMLTVVGWGVVIVAVMAAWISRAADSDPAPPSWLSFALAAALLFVAIPFAVGVTLVRYGSYLLTVAGILLQWFTMAWLPVSGFALANKRLGSLDELPMMIGLYLFLALLSSLPVIGLTMVRRWRMDRARESRQAERPSSALAP